jgi:NTP pyrophosphatase (non-canonical NTP hydrolase)
MRGLIRDLRQFAKERDWGKFHTSKNLAMALCVEASEILEIFQWLTPLESKNLNNVKRAELADEIGDVLIYLVCLSDALEIDPIEAARKKLAKNRIKYPAGKVRGKSLKYNEYQ